MDSRMLYLKKFMTIILLFIIGSINSQTSSLVYLDDGRLHYTPFANKGQTNLVNTIPDFSHAGYMGGGVALPDVPVVMVLSPVLGDNRESIQNAIDSVESLNLNDDGFRGTVLLKAGRYPVRGTLHIQKSGVVIRGEGQGSDGTVLFATDTVKHTFISIHGTGPGLNAIPNTGKKITTSYVPIGANSFAVSDASGFSIGDTIVVKRTPNQLWIDDLEMGQHGWTAAGYAIMHRRIVADITNNTIKINIPVLDAMEDKYGGGIVAKAKVLGCINNSGVENMRIESAYTSDIDSAHGWIAVMIQSAENCWVKKVTTQYFGHSTVKVDRSAAFNTIEDCACLDAKSEIIGGNRYSFTVSGMGNLVQRCYAREGRHDFLTGYKVTGPNVFLDCYTATAYSDNGPHLMWATGLLYDNIRSGQIRVWNRGGSGGGHGWVANTTMFWNVLSYGEVRVSSPIGGRNWGIGCKGAEQTGDGYWGHWKQPVIPRSLYLQQLRDRLGDSAVDNIAIEEQKTGDIYELLSLWAGEGDLKKPYPQKTIIHPIDDSYVQGGENSMNNYGNSGKITIKKAAVATTRYGFFKFDLHSINKKVNKAFVRFKLVSKHESSHQLHFVVNDTWEEEAITWSNKPDATYLIENGVVNSEYDWIEFDITSLVNNELDGDKLLSLQLSDAVFEKFVQVYSKESYNSEYHPQLVVEFENQTDNSKHISKTNKLQPQLQKIDEGFELHTGQHIRSFLIYGLNGKLIRSFNFQENNNTYRINTKNMAPGIYVYRVLYNSTLASFSGKFSISK